MDNEEFRAQVVKKLDSAITDKTQLTEILFYLGHQDEANRGYKNSAAWKTLRDLLESNEAFIAYAQRLLQEVDKNKQPIRDSMLEVYENLHLQGKKSNAGTPLTLDFGALTVCGSIGFAHAWVHITPEAQVKILAVLPHIMQPLAVSTAGSAVALVNTCGHEAKTVFATVYLTYEAIKSIHSWWKGEITGKRAAKNIVESCATVAAGAGGSVAGAALGSLSGPIGMVVGGVLGGIAASAAAGIISDTLTQELFDIPKDEALERAYNFLGVSRRSTDDDITKAYRSLCLKYHPDKGGSQQNFLKLQSCMGIIQVAREEEH
uniref:J domain-containing protein n=1 Tax=Plectus sambesii TaxID=2011161 RepID=A0A914VTU2_9BILA